MKTLVFDGLFPRKSPWVLRFKIGFGGRGLLQKIMLQRKGGLNQEYVVPNF